MVITNYYTTRKDGVNLFISFDGIEDSEGNIIPSGLKIRKKGTDELYDVAIDVEDAGFKYEETNIKIDDQLNFFNDNN